jgi:hypothetical protein
MDSKKYLTIMGAVGALVIGLTQYPDSPQAAVPQPAAREESPAVPFTGGMPKGYSPNAVVRDPFAVPAQFQPQLQPPASLGVVRDRQAEKFKEPTPVVTGIVGSGSQRAAIIQSGSDSRSYRVNERAGAYVITAISAASVTFMGPEGSIVAPLGR